MGGVVLPPCSLFGLRDPALGSAGLCGKVSGDLEEGLRQGGTFPDCCDQDACPSVSSCRPMPPQETLRHQQVVLAQPPVGSLLLSAGSRCGQDFVCALQDWSVCFPQSCGSLTIKSRWPSGSDSLGFPVPLLGPRAGSPMWGSELSQQWENFFGIIVFQSVGHPLSGSGM